MSLNYVYFTISYVIRNHIISYSVVSCQPNVIKMNKLVSNDP